MPHAKCIILFKAQSSSLSTPQEEPGEGARRTQVCFPCVLFSVCNSVRGPSAPLSPQQVVIRCRMSRRRTCLRKPSDSRWNLPAAKKGFDYPTISSFRSNLITPWCQESMLNWVNSPGGQIESPSGYYERSGTCRPRARRYLWCCLHLIMR